DDDANLARGDDDAQRCRFELQRLADARGGDADDLYVIAIDHHGEEAEQEHAHLVTAERALLDERPRVDTLYRHLTLPCRVEPRRFPALAAIRISPFVEQDKADAVRKSAVGVRRSSKRRNARNRREKDCFTIGRRFGFIPKWQCPPHPCGDWMRSAASLE